MSSITCPTCEAICSSKARACPTCGEPEPHHSLHIKLGGQTRQAEVVGYAPLGVIVRIKPEGLVGELDYTRMPSMPSGWWTKNRETLLNQPEKLFKVHTVFTVTVLPVDTLTEHIGVQVDAKGPQT